MKTKIIIASLFVIVIISIIFLTSNTSGNELDNEFIVVGKKFSEVKQGLSENFVSQPSSGDRITHSFLNKDNNLMQFAVKDDIIEVVEVYNILPDANSSYTIY